VSNFVVANGRRGRSVISRHISEDRQVNTGKRGFISWVSSSHVLRRVPHGVGRSRKPIELNAKAPDFRNFHDRIWAGDVSLGSKDAKLQYASVHVNQFLQNAREARFHDALEIVSIGR